MNFYLVASPYEDRGASSSSWINFPINNNQTISDFFNSRMISNNPMTVSSSIKDMFAQKYKLIGQQQDCDGTAMGGTYDLVGVIRIASMLQSQLDDWNQNFAGKVLEIIMYGGVPISSGYNFVPIWYFKKVLPTLSSINGGSIYSDYCLADILAPLNLSAEYFNFTNSNMNGTFYACGCDWSVQQHPNSPAYGNFCISDYVPPTPECDDVRNSADQQSLHLVVSDGQNNVTTTDITFNLSDGQNQELALKTYMNDKHRH